MYKLLLKSKKINVLTYIYIATLFLSFHYYLTTYINSSFLGQYVKNSEVGLVYTVSSIISICFFLLSSRILERFGTYQMMTWVVGIDIALLGGLIISDQIFWVIFIFTLHNAINPIILLNLDNILENSTNNNVNGRMRAIFLTLMNMTAVVSPIIVGSILTEASYKTIYLLSALALFPLLYIIIRSFKNIRDNTYHHPHLANGIQTFLENKNIKNIYISNLLLQIFYSWMVIYIPIYLHEQLGFNWQQLGLMISIALLPFVLLEIPVGTLADKKLGEKELLIAGFIITTLSLFCITLATIPSFVIWASILLMSRIGASLIEITTESYFFKQINSSNQNLISTFRTAGPLGTVIGPLVGSALLITLNYQFIFAILGVIMLSGIYFASKIKDSL